MTTALVGKLFCVNVYCMYAVKYFLITVFDSCQNQERFRDPPYEVLLVRSRSFLYDSRASSSDENVFETHRMQSCWYVVVVIYYVSRSGWNSCCVNVYCMYLDTYRTYIRSRSKGSAVFCSFQSSSVRAVFKWCEWMVFETYVQYEVLMGHYVYITQINCEFFSDWIKTK
jgi:hypothetical protein